MASSPEPGQSQRILADATEAARLAAGCGRDAGPLAAFPPPSVLGRLCDDGVLPHGAFVPPSASRPGAPSEEDCASDPRAAAAAAALHAALIAFDAAAGSVASGGDEASLEASVAPLRGGVINSAFRVDLPCDSVGGRSTTAVVVRVRGTGDGLSVAAREYAKEALCMRSYRGAVTAADGAEPLCPSCPSPLAVGVLAASAASDPSRRGRTLFAFGVQECADGTQGSLAANGTASSADVWRQLGVAAKVCHRVPVRGYGDRVIVGEEDNGGGNDNEGRGTADSGGRRPVPFAERSLDACLSRLVGRLEDVDDPLRRTGRLSPGQALRCVSSLRDLRRKNDAGVFDVGLCHGDLSPSNCLVEGDGASSRVVSIVDWGMAESSAVPHGTLAKLLEGFMYGSSPNDEELSSFLEGCDISTERYKKILPEVRSFVLLRALERCRRAQGANEDVILDLTEHLHEVLKRWF